MFRTLRFAIPLFVGVLFFSLASSQEGKKYSIKITDSAVPAEVAEPIQKLLNKGSVQLLDSAGKPLCEVWFRRELPAEATPEQLKTGVSFREVKQTEILGAIQFHVPWSDYRKQKIKTGVYTMRLAYQPTDGKHTADVSDFQEFVLVIGAKDDKRAALIEPKALHDASGESLGIGHPGVFMLWPVANKTKGPVLSAQPKDHWVLSMPCPLVVGGKTTTNTIAIGITLVGHSPAE
jgi:hypothetical protein